VKTAVLKKIHELRIESRKIPSLGPEEVLVAVKRVGICGSDVHYYEQGRIGKQVVKKPLVLGHEAAGIIKKVAPGVEKVKVGDKVAIEPGTFCGRCEYCLTGKYNLCSEMKFFGTPPIDGAYTQYIVHPADLVYPLPEKISLDEGALIEPLAVATYAVLKANLPLNSTVAILGSGPIGLLTLQVAKTVGKSFCLTTDLLPYRVKMAKKLGADVSLNAQKQKIVPEILKHTQGKGVDFTFDCAGEEETYNQAVEITKPGGEIILIGTSQEDYVKFALVEMIRKEITLKTIRRFKNIYPTAISLVESRKIKLKPLITHRFSLSEIKKGFELVKGYHQEVIKVIVEV
jgi:L-iditol 2-dehydrogenase